MQSSSAGKEALEEFFCGTTILVWGLGREGTSFLQLASGWKDVSLVVTDRVEPDDARRTLFSRAQWLPEPEAVEQLDRFDWVVKSPGVCVRKFGLSHEACGKILSQCELLLRFSPGPVVGVTGTKGKSTTAALLYQMILRSGRSARVVGNFGTPPLEGFETLSIETFVVCELSSYQLEFMRASPHVAVWLNLFPEHLDYHGGFQEYQKAKARIALFQKPGDYLIYHGSDAGIQEALTRFPLSSQPIPFDLPDGRSLPESPFLQGRHNRLNIIAAARAAQLLGIETSAIFATIQDFQGLPHRLERIGVFDGITYYDDAISTVPQATLAALEAIRDTATLILGGQDRGIPYEDFARKLARSSVSTLLLLPPSGLRLAKVLSLIDPPFPGNILVVQTLEEAVEEAFRHTPKGKSCLFSPAAPSAPPFRNFEERGEAFKHLVRAMGSSANRLVGG